MMKINTLPPDQIFVGSIDKSRSIFYAYAKHITTKEEAEGFIDKIKKECYFARHVVYSYLLLDGSSKCSDDGEPSGTAGIPLLTLLKEEQLTNTIIVVARKYGGVKLGTGNLARAYKESAKVALLKSLYLQYQYLNCYRCTVLDYKYYQIESTLKNQGGVVIKKEEIEDQITFDFLSSESVYHYLINYYNGQIEINKIAEGYYLI